MRWLAAYFGELLIRSPNGRTVRLTSCTYIHESSIQYPLLLIYCCRKHEVHVLKALYFRVNGLEQPTKYGHEEAGWTILHVEAEHTHKYKPET